MTEQPFGQEEFPPVQDSTQSHTPGQSQQVSSPQLVENVYQQHAPAIEQADSLHETLVTQSRQISALMAKLAKYEKPQQQDIVTAPAGGAPVKHHLHLVDGRVVVGHDGIATHFSETLPDGSTKVTRIKEYYPADEPDPSTLNA